MTQLTDGNVKVELHNDSDMSVCPSISQFICLPVCSSVCWLSAVDRWDSMKVESIMSAAEQEGTERTEWGSVLVKEQRKHTTN